jgi:hypothetical protein
VITGSGAGELQYLVEKMADTPMLTPPSGDVWNQNDKAKATLTRSKY